MAVELVIAPAEEPVSLAQAKAHLRVEVSDEDALITGLIAAARQWAETFTRRAFVAQTWRLWLDAFPVNDGGLIELPHPRLASVTDIQYSSTADGTMTVLAGSEYQVDSASEPARIVPAYGKSWPATRDQINAARVQYVAGYGDAAAIPEGIKRAMLQHVGHCYEHREPVDKAGILGTIELMLYPFRVFRFV